MKTRTLKETVQEIQFLGYNVIEYNMSAGRVGHIIIKSNYITGTIIGIILKHYQIHSIASTTRTTIQITIEKTK